MKTSLLSVAVVGFFGLLLYSCSSPLGGSSTGSGSSSTYTNQVLPTSLIMPVPSSLASGAGTTSSSSTPAFARSTTYSSSSGGYAMMKTAVSSMESMGQSFVLFGFIIDAIITQNSLSPGTYASENVTLTQALYNAINAQLPTSDQIPSSEIGQTQSVSNVVYSTSGSSPLQDSVSITESGTTMTYAWSTDRTKLKITATATGTAGQSFTYSFDTATMSAAFIFDDTTAGVSFKMAMKDSSTSSTSAAYVYMTGTQTSTSGNTSFAVWGYADSNGGLMESQFSASGSYFYYEEGFDNTGTLLYAAVASTSSSTAPSSSSSAWSVDSTYSNNQPVTTYDSDLSTASNSSTYPALTL